MASRESTTPEPDTETFLKRRIASLTAQLEEASGNKRRKSQSERNKGRAIKRVVSLYETIDTLIEERDRRAALEDDAEGPIPVQTLTQERNFESYKQLIRFIPGLKNRLVESDPDSLNIYLKSLKEAADAARSVDTGNLKKAVVIWLPELYKPPNPHLHPAIKVDRGFGHDDTGRLLCPIELDWEDPNVRAGIRQFLPGFRVTADSWPAFCYENEKMDPQDPEKGFLRSLILLKAFKLIFTSPHSADSVTIDGDGVSNSAPQALGRRRNHTRENNASLIGIREVTPRSLAYIACQLRMALSSMNSWSDRDDFFVYRDFYNNIVDYFELDVGARAKARSTTLLKWWTSAIFGSTLHDYEETKEGSSVAKMMAWRATGERNE